MCFDCEDNSAPVLKGMAVSIVSKVGETTGFPEVLKYFPKTGLIPNSEKFNLRNVMGYSFLSRGYLASYRVDGMEFDCFVIQGEDEARTQERRG